MKHLYSFQRAICQLFAAVAGPFLALGLLLGSPAAQAQAPSWQTAQVLGQGGTIITATATDATGNVYVAGHFLGTLTLGTTTLISAGQLDGFVAKYQPATASFSWVVPVRGNYFDYVTALAVQGNSVYLAGRYSSNTLSIGPYTLTNQGNYALYVAKLTDAGNTASVVWAVPMGGPGGSAANALAVNGTSVYVAGNFGDSAATFGISTLNAAGEGDGFVAKLTDGGNTATWTWAKAISSPASEVVNALVVVGSNLYLAGEFMGSKLGIGTTTLRNSGYQHNDLFVAKLVDAGPDADFRWAKAAGSSDTKARTIAASGTSVYVGGTYAGRAAPFGNTSLTAIGYEGFVWKLLDAGATSSEGWAHTIDAGNNYATNEVNSLVVRGSSVVVAGTFSNERISLYNAAAAGPGHGDVFVARLTDAGSSYLYNWVRAAGGSDYDTATALAVSQGQVYVAGYFESATAQFGSLNLAATTANGRTAFLASLQDMVLPTHGSSVVPALGLFPTPAHATTAVRLAAPATLTLLDALGRVVRTAQAPASQDYPLDLTGLAPGVYALRVQAGEAQAMQRLAVE